MALSFPLSLAAFADKLRIPSVDWKLQDNREFSGLGSGQIIAADLGPSLWTADLTTVPMRTNEAREVEALINAVIRANGSFYMHDPRKCVPRVEPPTGLYPGPRWDFASGNDGWGVSGGSRTASGGILTFTSVKANDVLVSPLGSYKGSDYPAAKVRLRRSAGTGAFNGAFRYNAPIGSLTILSAATAPSVPENWSDVIYDTRGKSNSAQWLSEISTYFRFSFYSPGSTEVDYIELLSDQFPGTAKIATLPNAYSMTLSGLAQGFTLSTGDYLSFDYGTSPVRRAFHEVSETVVADATGTTPAFEVSPFIRPGAAVGATVTLVKPSMVCRIVPGSLKVSFGVPFTTISLSVVQKI